MKKIIISLRNNLIILGGLTFGVDVLLDALDIQPPIILVMIWSGFLIILIFFIIKSKLLFGLYISALILSLFFLNRKKLKFLNTINTSQSCYEYLGKLQEMIKNNVRFTTRLLGIGLPFFGYVGLCIFIFESNMENFILDTYSSKQLLIKSIMILVSLSVIGIVSFRLSNYLVYGRLITKIDEMIDELDQLKK